MDDFSTPGTRNAFGLPASPANYIGKGQNDNIEMQLLLTPFSLSATRIKFLFQPQVKDPYPV